MKASINRKNMIFSVSFFNYLAIFSLAISFLPVSGNAQNGFVVGHNQTDLSQIPDTWITQAKADLHIAYNHTSHGSQLISGMNALESYPSFGDKYKWTDTSTGDNLSLSLDDHGISGKPDLSQGDEDSDGDGIADWAEDTYDFLDNTNNYHINVVMWSWCNIGGHNIPRYLNSMEWLIDQFGEGGTHPRAGAHPVKFVFMTAHANGGGEGDSSDSRNEQIRAHVNAHNRILFDFSDIENYDPDQNYYLDKRLTDALYYDNAPPYNSGPRDGNWAAEYIAAHDDSELDRLTTGDNVAGYGGCSSCAHSNGPGNLARLNCVLKGRAVWHLFARLAGWNGGTTNVSESAPDIELFQNYPNPFKHTTHIKYQVPTRGKVIVRIYDFLGRKIKTLVDKKENAGLHEVEFSAKNLSSGIYFVELIVGKMKQTRKIILSAK